MNFLTPGVIAAAAALTIPPLIALYFLKLKREQQTVPSTLLWKRAVEDLHVNAPFQRLRSSLLLLLQLLILIAAALALGKPMFETVESSDDTVILLIDQSASMNVVEAGGKTRLEIAIEQAKLTVDNLADNARAMVIAFCDRATVVSSFDTNKEALRRKIDSIEPTQSTSSLGEAMSLAEAYTQNIIIAGEEAGRDIAPESTATPATLYLFTDGRIADSEKIALQRFDTSKMIVTNVATRADNVGILAMDARRNYQQPERVEVTATVQNFGPDEVAFDAVLLVEGDVVDIQEVRLAPAITEDKQEPGASARAAIGSIGVCVFDEFEFGGAGVIEVVLRTKDALSADNHAWTVVRRPRHLSVLLVTNGNLFLSNVLAILPLELAVMTPDEYEEADDEQLLDGKRSKFDVVLFDGHSTARLPQGNYLFWGAIPEIAGVSIVGKASDQVIVNWDETHPILRHVAVEGITVYEWLVLALPPDSVSLMDGEASPVMSYLTRDASQYLISAFRLVAQDDLGNPFMNTYWVTQVDFVIFMQNAVQFLASNIATSGAMSITPGAPVTLPVPDRTREVTIHRPDNSIDKVPTAGYQSVHYARTRQVGVYTIEPGVEGEDRFAVNLYSARESRIEPAKTLAIGSESVLAQSGSMAVNKPAWTYFLLAMLVVLLLEWVVYNQRVFV